MSFVFGAFVASLYVTPASLMHVSAAGLYALGRERKLGNKLRDVLHPSHLSSWKCRKIFALLLATHVQPTLSVFSDTGRNDYGTLIVDSKEKQLKSQLMLRNVILAHVMLTM